MPAITRRGITLTAMIFAVAMTFIDQTIVSVAAPQIQTDLGLSNSGLQWGINSYLLALTALFVLGGRLADTHGQRRMVTIGILIFSAASALCGLTPTGPLAAAWLITFRAVQGAGGALMYPAALAIVLSAARAEQRGRALAVFFGAAGALTAVGPTLGAYLIGWTWRSIFWINIPIAIIALLLTARARPSNERRPARLDLPGLTLITAGVALSVFGLQQSAHWGWHNPLTVTAIAAGVALLAGFVLVELRTESPLMDVTMFRNRSFRVDNIVLFLATIVFIPIFFFASEYGQVALDQTPAKASLMLLYFFTGFVVAAQVGGRMLDRIGARRPVIIGATLAAIGLHLWATHVTSMATGTPMAFIVLAGAGMGLLLGQANTDALNHTPANAYGEATGITQTIRNFGASLGLAVLGSVLVTQLRAHLADSLSAQGLDAPQAHATAARIAQFGGGSNTTTVIPDFVRADFAQATGSVLLAMSWVMVAAAIIGLLALPRGQRHTPEPREALAEANVTLETAGHR